MGRGKPINRADWPSAGPVRVWLEYLDQLHRENGLLSLRDIAPAMKLTAPTRVSELLRGRKLPADERQAQSLLMALGGLDAEVRRGLRLYGVARQESEQVSRGPLPSWWQRSGYLDQVRDIAPTELLGREIELRRLADFCTGGDTYLRVRAPARSGKTALLSWFALHPPPGVWVVSFFVTAHLATQSDSSGYTDALLDQLAAITGESLPPHPLPGAADRLRRQWLQAATEKAATAGTRIVLLVDGLDEDRGVRPGSGLASIASLLPRSSGSGLPVVASGRPDPPLPADLGPDHPLRTSPVWDLDPSSHAREVAGLAARELDEALAGAYGEEPALVRDLVGLVTAAGGGLRRRDLEELTQRGAFEIDAILHGVVGRTIAHRNQICLFTHETLAEQAVHRLGPSKLATYRTRLGDWADDWARQGWPADTPPYLLTSYQRMLADTGDLARLSELARDMRRHERMFARTGGDAAALEEIAAAQDLLDSQNPSDLELAARLAVHRDLLIDRNQHLPTALPAVWALLGNPIRAHALAAGVVLPHRRVSALAMLAQALFDAGDEATARRIADEAEQVARGMEYPYARASALAVVAGAMAEIGCPDNADAIADSIAQESFPDDALISLAKAHLGHRATELARSVARRIQDETRRQKIEAEIDVTGQPSKPSKVPSVPSSAVVSDADAITDVVQRGEALSRLAHDAARAGDYELATELATRTESAAPTAINTVRQSTQAECLVAALCKQQQLDEAASLIDFALPNRRLSAYNELARMADRVGDTERATEFTRHAEDLAATLFHKWAPSLRDTADPAALTITGDAAGNAHESEVPLLQRRSVPRDFAAALHHGRWQEALADLNSIAPAAVRAIADEFRTTAQPQPKQADPQSGWRVLIMDDHEDVAVLIGRLLKPICEEVELTFDGASGIAAAARMRPDIVITNYVMPDMTGPEVIMLLRRVTDVPIIITSATTAKSGAELCFAMGADIYLEKPFTRSTLLNAVWTLIQNRPAVSNWLTGPDEPCRGP